MIYIPPALAICAIFVVLVTALIKITDPPGGVGGSAPSNLITVEHDGHRWIMPIHASRSAQPVHHPDCPCTLDPEPSTP